MSDPKPEHMVQFTSRVRASTVEAFSQAVAAFKPLTKQTALDEALLDWVRNQAVWDARIGAMQGDEPADG